MENASSPILGSPTAEMLGLSPSEGWVPAEPFPRMYTKHSFVSGNLESNAIRVRYFKNDRLKNFAGKAWFGPETEGPPGHAHGGSQASLLDEVMGAVAWVSGYQVLAAKIEINFRIPLPLGTSLTAFSQIEKVEGRKVYVSGKLQSEDGRIFSESSGLFVVINPDSLIRAKEKAS